MSSTNANTGRMRGRPRLASRTLLEEAASELFLERGYAHTTVDEIALRAGVSRNTFFNYFSSKADVFWVDIDRALATLPQHLAATSPNTPVVQAIGEAFAHCADELGKGVVPWILTNFETIGQPDEVMESALQRFGAQASVLRTFVSERLTLDRRELTPQLIANTCLAAVVSAAVSWGNAGTQREALRTYLKKALEPLAKGFALPR